MPYCYTGQSLKTKDSNTIKATKRKVSEHIQRWWQLLNLLMGVWFRGYYLPLLSRCESDKIQSRCYNIFFKRGYFAIDSKLKPASAKSACFSVALRATNLFNWSKGTNFVLESVKENSRLQQPINFTFIFTIKFY